MAFQYLLNFTYNSIIKLRVDCSLMDFELGNFISLVAIIIIITLIISVKIIIVILVVVKYFNQIIIAFSMGKKD